MDEDLHLSLCFALTKLLTITIKLLLLQSKLEIKKAIRLMDRMILYFIYYGNVCALNKWHRITQPSLSLLQIVNFVHRTSTLMISWMTKVNDRTELGLIQRLQ
jgi:uncharacterized membrane protein